MRGGVVATEDVGLVAALTELCRAYRGRLGIYQLLQMSAGAGQGGTCVEVAQSMRRYVDTLVAQAPSPEKATEAHRLIEDPPIRIVALNGNRARAQIAGQSDKPIPLVRGDGGWKIAGFPFPGQ